MGRCVTTYCGPAAVASALGISREEAAARLMVFEPRSRGSFHHPSIAKAVKSSTTFHYANPYWRPTLSQWLRKDHPPAIVFVSSHFVHVEDGVVLEHNGWPCLRGRVKAVIHLPVGRLIGSGDPELLG